MKYVEIEGEVAVGLAKEHGLQRNNGFYTKLEVTLSGSRFGQEKDVYTIYWDQEYLFHQPYKSGLIAS